MLWRHFQQFAYLHSVLVGHHMGIGNDESVLWYNEPGAAGYGNLPLGKHHPEKREGETLGLGSDFWSQTTSSGHDQLMDRSLKSRLWCKGVKRYFKLYLRKTKSKVLLVALTFTLQHGKKRTCVISFKITGCKIKWALTQQCLDLLFLEHKHQRTMYSNPFNCAYWMIWERSKDH